MDKTDALPVVFAGPTISKEDVDSILPAICLPPAAQGDVIKAVLQFDPSVILIIDGTFQNEPAIRHKEILWALDRGIAVCGAASMGALRAAELWKFGMRGFGLIYRWYRRFALLPDDAVAVLHAPSDLGSVALSHALVDILQTIKFAHRRGAIANDIAAMLCKSARQLNFRERTLERVAAAVSADIPEIDVENLTGTLLNSWTAQKAKDARVALHALRSHAISDLRGNNRVPPFVLTTAFRRDLEHSGFRMGN